MPTVGYGEDALTFWAFQERCSVILHELRDSSHPRECTIFFRPSFGRGKQPNFGEFDCIFQTTHTIWLVESKWDNLSKTYKETVQIKKKEQIRRHSIFASYLKHWHLHREKSANINWNEFCQSYCYELDRNYRPPKEQRQLAKNLRHILDRLSSSILPVKNLVLYFHQSGHQPPTKLVGPNNEELSEHDFRLIPLQYQRFGDSGFFEMKANEN